MTEKQLLQEWTLAVSARLAYEARALGIPVTWLTYRSGDKDQEIYDGDVVIDKVAGAWAVKARQMLTAVPYAPIAQAGRLVAPLTGYELTEQGAPPAPQPVLDLVEQAAKALFRDLSSELIPLTRAHLPALVVTVAPPRKPHTYLAADAAFNMGPLVRSAGITTSSTQLQVLMLAGVTVADHWPAS